MELFQFHQESLSAPRVESQTKEKGFEITISIVLNLRAYRKSCTKHARIFEPWEGITCLRAIRLMEKPVKLWKMFMTDMDLTTNAAKHLTAKEINKHVHQKNYAAR